MRPSLMNLYNFNNIKKYNNNNKETNQKNQQKLKVKKMNPSPS